MIARAATTLSCDVALMIFPLKSGQLPAFLDSCGIRKKYEFFLSGKRPDRMEWYTHR